MDSGLSMGVAQDINFTSQIKAMSTQCIASLDAFFHVLAEPAPSSDGHGRFGVGRPSLTHPRGSNVRLQWSQSNWDNHSRPPDSCIVDWDGNLRPVDCGDIKPDMGAFHFTRFERGLE
jgi:hypothetical protein